MADTKPNEFSEELLDKLRYYIQDNNTLRASRNLRAILFDYIRFQAAGLPIDFDDVLNDVEAVINLLESIADETKDRSNSVT